MSHIVRIATDRRRSRAVVYNAMVFIGGQTADDRSQDIRGQTTQALAKIEKLHGQESPPDRTDLDKGHRQGLRRYERDLGRLDRTECSPDPGDRSVRDGCA